MYLDSLEFLEEERETWAPYEALGDLDDAALERPTDPAGPGHGWSGRDLMSHMAAWQGFVLGAARELAVRERSATLERVRESWRARGDALNEELLAEWRALPLAEVRRRFREIPGELRGYLTVVPEIRWLKDPQVVRWISGNTTEHYAEHRSELDAILAEPPRG